MMIYTIEHKHCGMTTEIIGENEYDAFKKNNINGKIWKVIDCENC